MRRRPFLSVEDMKDLTEQYMMEAVIKTRRRQDKKLDAVIDGKKTISFGQKTRRTSRFIRMTTGSKGTSPGTRRMKTGEILKLLDSIRDSFFGINQPYRLRLMIQMQGIKFKILS